MEAEAEGTKYDEGKLMMSLIPTESIIGAAEVLTFGAHKYGVNNWQKVTNAEQRYIDALLRHLYTHQGGETLDPETGLSHLKHALTNLMFLIHFQEKGEDTKEEEN